MSDKAQSEEVIASKSDVDAVLSAVQELTKSVVDLVKSQQELKAEWEKWRKAGKF